MWVPDRSTVCDSFYWRVSLLDPVALVLRQLLPLTWTKRLDAEMVSG